MLYDSDTGEPMSAEDLGVTQREWDDTHRESLSEPEPRDPVELGGFFLFADIEL